MKDDTRVKALRDAAERCDFKATRTLEKVGDGTRALDKVGSDTSDAMQHLVLAERARRWAEHIEAGRNLDEMVAE